MLVVHAVFPIKPEKQDEAEELAEELVQQSNQETGMIEYRAAADVDDENVLRFFEQFALKYFSGTDEEFQVNCAKKWYGWKTDWESLTDRSVGDDIV